MSSLRCVPVVVVASFLACGGTGAVTPPDPTGAGGDSSSGGQAGDGSTGGATTSTGGAGTAGTTGGNATAGTSATGGKGTGAMGGGTAAGGSGPFGGSGPAGGAGGVSGTGGSGPFGPGGGTGTGGKASGNIIPTSCSQAHDAAGCCGPDGKDYYCAAGSTTVTAKSCKSGTKCGWSSSKSYYDCVSSGGGAKDPSGANPITCGP